MPRRKGLNKSNSHILDRGQDMRLTSYRLTERQKEFLRLSLSDDLKVMFIVGPAGCSKTYMSVYSALRELQRLPKSDLLYVRTVIESADQNLGYLPGDIEDKFNPYMSPLIDKLYEISPGSVNELLKSERVSAVPVNYLRGANWENKIVIADEAQNFSFKELTTLITRIGKDTKLFVCGDLMQSDINGKTGFADMVRLFNDEESKKKGIHFFRFSEKDIKRSEILKFIIKKLSSI